jgi:hypothetical protein
VLSEILTSKPPQQRTPGRRLRWAGHVARVEKYKSTLKMLTN